MAGVKSDDPVDHDPQGESKTRDKVAKEYGITGRTLSSIKKVMESGNPEAIKVMDEKSVNAGLKLLNPSKPDEKYAARFDELFADEAAQKQKTGKRDLVDTCPQGRAPETNDRVGKLLGMSGEIYRRAKAVQKSGDQELIKLMDEKSIKTAYNELNDSGFTERAIVRQILQLGINAYKKCE